MIRNLKNEEWKRLVIPGMHENESYEISNYGRVKSFKCHKNGKLIKVPIIKGYKSLVVKMKNNSYTTKYIHKLVAEHFIQKDNELQQYVIHIDFDKLNNHVSNLKWVTRQTMFAHQKINPNYKRGQIYNAKLTELEVAIIKNKLLFQKVKPSTLAREYGITHTQLNRIKRGENWAHVKVSEPVYN